MINKDLIENLIRYNPNKINTKGLRCIGITMRKKDSSVDVVTCANIVCKNCNKYKLKIHGKRYQVDER